MKKSLSGVAGGGGETQICSGSEVGSYFRLLNLVLLDSRLEGNKEEEGEEVKRDHSGCPRCYGGTQFLPRSSQKCATVPRRARILGS